MISCGILVAELISNHCDGAVVLEDVCWHQLVGDRIGRYASSLLVMLAKFSSYHMLQEVERRIKARPKLQSCSEH